MLRQLVDFAPRIPNEFMAPAAYRSRAVKYALHLTERGEPLGLVSTTNAKTKQGVERFVPDLVRTSGVRPLLLIDKASYVLGYRPPTVDAGREDDEHGAFVALVQDCASATNEPSVKAVLRFLQCLTSDVTEELLRPHPDFDPEARIQFIVGEQSPVDAPSVQQFWAERCAPPADGPLFECLVCGKRRPQVGVHPFPIKRIPGGQSSGNFVVSTNERAFESYGLSGNQVSPTCRTCAEAYGKSLNYLLSNPSTRLLTKTTAYVFWTRGPGQLSVAHLFSDPSPEEVTELLKSPLTGAEAATDINAEPFFTLGLSARRSRVVVRTWIDTTLGEAKRHIRDYFASQELVNWDGTRGDPLPIFRLTGGTVRDSRKDSPPETVEKALVRFALEGTPIPQDVLFLAVQRNRASQSVSRPRAMLIKMVLISEGRLRGDEMNKLNPEHPNQAYHLGRALALFDAIQYQALGKVNTSVVDKFYGTASSAPATVFPLLQRLSQHHLRTIHARKKGQHNERALEAVMDQISDLPKVLSLPEQGLFALGYYHQRAANHRAFDAYQSARERSGGADETE